MTLPSKILVPVANEAISAGFPSPAESYLEESIDLNQHLIRNAESTFYLRVTGDSMTNAGIHDGDLLIVDRSLEVKPGCIIVAILDGEFILKKLIFHDNNLVLKAESPNYPPINLANSKDIQIWGVAIYSIHALRKNSLFNHASNRPH